MSMEIVLRNGTVYDPANGIDGEKMDILIRDGRIVEKVSPGARMIDVEGKVVMPGGVDIHTHISGSKINAGRIMRPEDVRGDTAPRTSLRRSVTGLTVPNLYRIGYTYAEMGYTTVVEGAVPPLKARHTHEELSSIPVLDKAPMILMGNNWLLMKYLAEGEQDLAREYAAWLLEQTKGYGIKIVNPGGTEAWGWGGNVKGPQEKVPRFDIEPSRIIRGLVRINEELGLPTSVHLHPNGLGVPGNAATLAETLRLVRGVEPSTPRDQVLHVVHLQFFSYGGDSWRNFSSESEAVAREVKSLGNVTVDAGAVIFGWATTMTADGPFEYTLQRLTHSKWTNADVEVETGAGVVPHFYSMKNPVSVVQWCTGIELLLLMDPKRIFLTTDSPNGGPFYKYPQLIHLLMSRRYRLSVLAKLHPIAKRCLLPSLEREYSLYEIAEITRSGTARALGLGRKGHLGIGADADISVYDIEPGVTKGIQRALLKARLVLKDGEEVVREGEMVSTPVGRTFWVRCPPSEERERLEADLDRHFRFYSIQRANYPVPESYLRRSSPIIPEVVAP